jgi:hypothetical protein
MMTVVVQTLLIDPICQRVSGVASTPVFRLMTPAAADVTSSSLRTPTEAPGTLCCAINSARRDCRL